MTPLSTKPKCQLWKSCRDDTKGTRRRDRLTFLMELDALSTNTNKMIQLRSLVATSENGSNKVQAELVDIDERIKRLRDMLSKAWGIRRG